MKKLLALLLVLVIGYGIYLFIFKKMKTTNDLKPEPIATKKHSDAFNTSVNNLVNAYLGIKDAFVDADTARAKQNTRELISNIDKVQLDELKKDTAAIIESAKSSLEDIRSNAVSLLAQTELTEMRQDFRMITEMMYPAFFKIINYEGPNLYLQNCPMAFGEDKAASWISNSVEIVNPYLGKNHPEYKGSMLHCGEVKDTIKAK